MRTVSLRERFLLLLVLHHTAVNSSAESGLSCLVGFMQPMFLQTASIDLELQNVMPSVEINHQVIYPTLKFNCSGYITAWSALTVLNIRFVHPHTLTHRVHFQVWRPNTDNTVYNLIGSSELMFDHSELRSVFQIDNSTDRAFFRFMNKTSSTIPFRPGDVIGCMIPAQQQTIFPSLSPVYHMDMATTGEMYIFGTSAQYCQVSSCFESTQVTLVHNVVPQISFNYEVMEDNLPTPLVPECMDVSIESCSKTSSTELQLVTTVTQATPCHSSNGCPNDPTTVPGVLLVIMFGAISLVSSIVVVVAIGLFCVFSRKTRSSERGLLSCTSTITRESQVGEVRRRTSEGLGHLDPSTDFNEMSFKDFMHMGVRSSPEHAVCVTVV